MPLSRAQVASIFLQVLALAQFLAGFEMRNILRRHLHFLTGLGIASGARGPIIQSEASEASDLDALPFGQAFRHRIEDHLYRQFGVLSDELWVARRELRDQLRLRHIAPLALIIVGCWLHPASP